MHGYSSFAVFGCGLIGMPIARELRARGASVLVLTRPGGCSDTVRRKLPGVEVFEKEYTDSEAIEELLRENAVQVIVSTVSAAEVAVQNQLATTAHAAGVELFVPSEFGVVTDGIGHNRGETSTIEHLKSIGLPFAIFYAGFFIETIPAMTGFAVNGKINVVGYGNMPCSFTASDDVAGFVAHVLTVHHPQDVFNRTFRLQGDRSTLSDLAVLFKTELEYVEEIPGQMGEVWKRMQMVAQCGAASTGWNIKEWAEGDEYAGCTNYLWEGHRWQTIKSFFGL
ncbi:hypothetical protein DFH08DRAFT_840398 [Mycena albidolilacea]|uniref:NmrA-like domain-containing protein n=1 Tax=Mycena albidolilacea TaxID=1033008 RepID=A0AAD7AQ57_9AGAR|nr:hypothetical protein DFH08DRAFT_840398 [Mycena albidolilacea]